VAVVAVLTAFRSRLVAVDREVEDQAAFHLTWEATEMSA
jgi:hypothetical protein